jgi:hypothetical protein
MKAVSVGFIPLDWKFSKDKARPFGIDFTKQELLEISVCPVPCNPNALQEAKSQGIDTGPIREWASKVLDEGGHILIPRNILEETFRQAKTPRCSPEVSCQVCRRLIGRSARLTICRLSMQKTWDAPAAAKRMLDDAGFGGDAPTSKRPRAASSFTTRQTRCSAAATRCRSRTSSTAN